jgi:hypothetical protein
MRVGTTADRTAIVERLACWIGNDRALPAHTTYARNHLKPGGGCAGPARRHKVVEPARRDMIPDLGDETPFGRPAMVFARQLTPLVASFKMAAGKSVLCPGVS